MLELNDLLNMRIEISFPKELSLEKEQGILNMPIEKVKTKSFGSVQMIFNSLVKDLFYNIPIISFRSKYGTFEVGVRSLRLELSPKEVRGRLAPSKNKKGKPIAIKDLNSFNIDSNYLFTSILGSLGLLGEKVKTKTVFHFEKAEIFKSNFNDKASEEFLRRNYVDEVWAISFKRKIISNRFEKELKFEFERNEKDEIRITDLAENVFSPFNISSMIEEKLNEINEILKGW